MEGTTNQDMSPMAKSADRVAADRMMRALPVHRGPGFSKGQQVVLMAFVKRQYAAATVRRAEENAAYKAKIEAIAAEAAALRTQAAAHAERVAIANHYREWCAREKAASTLLALSKCTL